MASSPDRAPAGPDDRPSETDRSLEQVRWPLLAKIGVAVAVTTVAVCIVAAVYAAFFFEGR